MKRRIAYGAMQAAIAAIVLIVTGHAMPAIARGASARVAVTAMVLPYAKMTVLSQPGRITVSAQDVERGYVDAPPVVAEVRNNTATGCLVSIAAFAAPCRSTYAATSYRSNRSS